MPPQTENTMEDERKCCCVKEPTGYVPIRRVMDKIDELAARDDKEGIARVLDYWEKEARQLGDDKGLLEILSEEIGFYRRADSREKGLAAVYEALGLLQAYPENGLSEATVYLNIATTLKAFGKVDEAMPHYMRAKDIYERLLPEADFRRAGLYNNYAAALVELKRYDEAKSNYMRAIGILGELGGNFPEIALTYVNLAQAVYDEYPGGEGDDRIDEYLALAKETLLSPDMQRDGNFASVCRKCSDAFGFFGYFMEKQEFAEMAKEIFQAKG